MQLSRIGAGRVVMVLLTLMLASACGQKGPLYLPPDSPGQPVDEQEQQ